MKKELSVIIPAYNEEERIAYTLGQIAQHLTDRQYNFEIIVVNDGSTDSTATLVSSLENVYPQIRFFDRKENKGKGETVKEGIGYARFPICLFMDADSSTGIEEWDKFERLFFGGSKVVIASRHLKDSNIVHPQPFIRRFLGGGYRGLCQALFSLAVSDFNCGFKAYETPIAKEVYKEVKMKDWTFDVEVFCLLKKRDVAVSEVPVRWEHREKKSNIAPVRTAIRTLGSIWELKKRY